MDTITTIQSLLKFNGSVQHVTVELMPSEYRLIAAAPELLEALVAAKKRFSELAEADSLGEYALRTSCAIGRDMASAALAKMSS